MSESADSNRLVAPSRASRIVGRLVILAVLLSLPGGLAFSAAFGEPYPGLFQPAFDGDPATGGVLHRSNTIIRIAFTHGPPAVTTRAGLMSSSSNPTVTARAPYAFNIMFASQEDATSPATESWLANRLRAMYPGRYPTAIAIVRRYWTVDLATGAQSRMKESITTIHLAGK